MKKLLLSALVLGMLSTGAVYAQNGTQPKQPAQSSAQTQKANQGTKPAKAKSDKKAAGKDVHPGSRKEDKSGKNVNAPKTTMPKKSGM